MNARKRQIAGSESSAARPDRMRETTDPGPDPTNDGRDRMRVYELVEPGDLRLRTVPRPTAGDGELIVRVSVALTCGTDVKMYERGHARLPLPSRMGHEWAGRVVATGPGVRSFREGDRIVATPTAPCSDCAYCVRGLDNLCLHLLDETAFGAFGEYLRVPRHVVRTNAFAVPDHVADHHAALLEPLACVLHGLGRVDIAGDRTVVMLGDGPIALIFAQLARRRGADQVIVVGRHDARLAAARAMGADVAIQARETDPIDAVRALTDGMGADVVIECVGRPAAWQEAVRLARRGGEVLFFGGCEPGAEVTLSAERIHYDELALRGAFHYTPAAVRAAWELIRGGALTLDPLITDRMPLDRLPEAIERVRSREALKIAIVP